MALSLTACGGDTEKTPSDGSTDNPVTSQSESSDPGAADKAWYYQGFQLDFRDSDFSGSMYCDGKSLWYTATTISEQSTSTTIQFSVEPQDDKTFKRTYLMSGGYPVETRIYDGEALDYYFTNGYVEHDNYGAWLNKKDRQFFDFVNYKKTNQTETVAGRKCTIYKRESSDYERTMSIDDEFGVVLKIRDTFYKSSGDGVFFEVTSIEFGAVQPPDDVVIKEQ